MKKPSKKILVLFCAICLFVSVLFIVTPQSQAVAQTKADAITDVKVIGTGIVDCYTYYLEWSGSSFDFNGKVQSPTAFLKCKEDEAFVKQAAVRTMKNNDFLESVNAGTYIAVAEIEGIEFIEGNTYQFKINPLNREVYWESAEGYVYNGKEQCPTASFFDAYGDSVLLDVKGKGLNAGSYTASVDVTTAGDNYILTNITFNYSISKFVGQIVWIVGEGYVENGSLPGPSAYCVGANGDVIEIPVKYSGSNVGEQTAMIDEELLAGNFELTGEEKSIKFNISEEKFKPLELAITIALLVLLIFSISVSVYLFILKREEKIKKDKEIQDKEITVQRKEMEIANLKGVNVALCQEKYILYDHNKKLKQEVIHNKTQLGVIQKQLAENDELLEYKETKYDDLYEDNIQIKIKLEDTVNQLKQANNKLEEVKKQLDETRKQLEETRNQLESLGKQSIVGAESELLRKERKKVSDLNKKIKKMLAEKKELEDKNKKLIYEINKDHGYPIETYLPSIKRSITDGLGMEYDKNNPNGTYIGLRQKLSEIERTIDRYEEQKKI